MYHSYFDCMQQEKKYKLKLLVFCRLYINKTPSILQNLWHRIIKTSEKFAVRCSLLCPQNHQSVQNMSLFVIFGISGPFTCHRKMLNMYVINKKTNVWGFLLFFLKILKENLLTLLGVYMCVILSHTGRLIIPIIMIIPEANCPTDSALVLQLSS